LAIIRKSDKELAFLYDLFVATDWGERFAELVDEHVHLPTKGRMLYLGAGTGGHALAIHERTGEKTSILLLEENEESLELAKAKSTALKEHAEFRSGRLDNLDLPDNQFNVVIGNATLISHRRVSRMISEMVRVAAPNATVAIVLPTASSFGEFFSIYWEALHNRGLIDHESDVENLITGLPTVSELELEIEVAGLEEISSSVQIEEFDFESGEAFLNAPLISDFLMHGWLESLADEDRENVAAEIAKIINEERHDGEFALTVKATLLVGRKAFAH
jgi:ubiquinone/menaquinone biosynthesis C-methylase UbiE